MRPRNTSKVIKDKAVPLPLIPINRTTDAPIVSIPASQPPTVYKAQEPLVLPIPERAAKRILAWRQELTMQAEILAEIQKAVAQTEAEKQRLENSIRDCALLVLDYHNADVEGDFTISADGTVLTMERRAQLVSVHPAIV